MPNDEIDYAAIEAAAEAWAPYAELLEDRAEHAIVDFKAKLRIALDEAVRARNVERELSERFTLTQHMGLSWFTDADYVDIDARLQHVGWHDHDGDKGGILSFREVFDEEARRQRAYAVVIEAARRRAESSEKYRAQQVERERAQLRTLLEKYPDEVTTSE